MFYSRVKNKSKVKFAYNDVIYIKILWVKQFQAMYLVGFVMCSTLIRI